MPDPITPDELRRAFTKLGEKEVVVVILDEFDRLVSQAARRAVADTIKTFADHGVPATIVVVGVADTVDDLIAEHRSIERALVQVPMRRMTTVELEAVLAKGVARLERSIDRDASLWIARLSQGLPHFTHALGLHAVRAAIDDESRTVRMPHVRQAILRAVADSEQSLVRRLEAAGVGRRHDRLLDRVLLAAALASSRAAGYFTAADVKAALALVLGQPPGSRAWEKHLDALCQKAQGPVLVRTGEGRQRHYRFDQPLLQPVLLMRGLLDSELREADVPDWLGTASASMPD